MISILCVIEIGSCLVFINLPILFEGFVSVLLAVVHQSIKLNKVGGSIVSSTPCVLTWTLPRYQVLKVWTKDPFHPAYPL